jgi:hypothetical protein
VVDVFLSARSRRETDMDHMVLDRKQSSIVAADQVAGNCARGITETEQYRLELRRRGVEPIELATGPVWPTVTGS